MRLRRPAPPEIHVRIQRMVVDAAIDPSLEEAGGFAGLLRAAIEQHLSGGTPDAAAPEDLARSDRAAGVARAVAGRMAPALDAAGRRPS